MQLIDGFGALLVTAVDEREPETVDADRRHNPGRLLGNGCIAENIGVELCCFVGVPSHQIAGVMT